MCNCYTKLTHKETLDEIYSIILYFVFLPLHLSSSDFLPLLLPSSPFLSLYFFLYFSLPLSSSLVLSPQLSSFLLFSCPLSSLLFLTPISSSFPLLLAPSLHFLIISHLFPPLLISSHFFSSSLFVPPSYILCPVVALQNTPLCASLFFTYLPMY